MKPILKDGKEIYRLDFTLQDLASRKLRSVAMGLERIRGKARRRSVGLFEILSDSLRALAMPFRRKKTILEISAYQRMLALSLERAEGRGFWKRVFS